MSSKALSHGKESRHYLCLLGRTIIDCCFLLVVVHCSVGLRICGSLRLELRNTLLEQFNQPDVCCIGRAIRNLQQLGQCMLLRHNLFGIIETNRG